MTFADIRHQLRSISRRMVLCGLLLVLALPIAVAYHYAKTARAQAPGNPIVLENQQPGSNPWFWSKLGNDATGQIKGYASATSVDQGQNITFHVSVNPAQTYTIDFYRIGWYGGLGGRHRQHLGPLNGFKQQTCPTNAQTGMIACNWSPSYTLTVPSDWTSGVYVALLTNAAAFQNYVMFVVKDGRPAPFLYQQSVATEQAYNNYPNNGTTGKSLYAYNSYGANTVSGNPSAVKVSFDRPYADGGLGGALIRWEISLIQWLERSGYDVTYSTNIDTHSNGPALLNHKAFLSPAHDEYWSKEMFDAAENARDTGVNLAFFGANTAYTQVRFEPSASGAANRVVVCYRNTPWTPTDPVQGPTTTSDFRLAPVSRPEQTLVGVQYVATLPNTDYVVTNSSHWVYAGTGFTDGAIVPGIVGYEADALMGNYPPPNSTNQTLLSQSPYVDNGVTKYLHSSIYQAPSGAWVFAAGTMSWSWALVDPPGPYAQFRVDPRIQQTTANILNAFLNGPPPTITSFSPASGPVGASVTIDGTNFNGATAVKLNGTAANFSIISGTAIQATVPAGATSGTFTVTTAAGTATSANSFTVVPPPGIVNFTPVSGPVGTSVTINGSHFTTATTVAFNGTAAGFTVTSDAQIQAIVPSGATTGAITVTTPSGTAMSVANFAVIYPPTIASVTPASGPVGATVTINGANFSGTTSVTFNGVSSSFTVTSETVLQAIVPAGATTGTLSVTTSAGTATSAASFTVTAALTVTKTNTLGLGDGTVTSSPAGINCGPTCSASYSVDTVPVVVTLTATPALLSGFDGWTGCATVSGNTCTVSMTGAKSVVARFLP